jgi:hypothetical protein
MTEVVDHYRRMIRLFVRWLGYALGIIGATIIFGIVVGEIFVAVHFAEKFW